MHAVETAAAAAAVNKAEHLSPINTSSFE